jgi:single-strand DNA-binding protein
MAKSLNKVQLIGNLTRDPELRYTPSGSAVCTFGMATNRSWTTDTGEKHDEPEFHRIVTWNKLAEICSQFLVKGRQVYIEGRLQTRSYTAADNQQKSITEIVADNMILLDRGHGSAAQGSSTSQQEASGDTEDVQESTVEKSAKKTVKKESPQPEVPEVSDEDIAPEDIPF